MTTDSPQERFRKRWSGSPWAAAVIGTLLTPVQFMVARGAGAAAGATASSDAAAGKAASKKTELRRTGFAERYMGLAYPQKLNTLQGSLLWDEFCVAR
jgi:hypothetical protein